MLRVTHERSTSIALAAALAAALACDISPPTGLARPGPGPSPLGDTVSLRLQRFSTGSGSILVSSGIPLPPGRLRPNATANVTVIVGGQEKAIYIEPLASRHVDGSVRSILVQFRHPLTSGVPVTGLLVVGPSVRRGTTDLAKTPVPAGMPAAVALPTSAEYLVSTELVGRTVPASESPFTEYEQNFVTYGNNHWARDGGYWPAVYYERPLAWWAYWVRTGNHEYWRRGVIDMLAYRDDYAIPNGYGLQPHWIFVEALGVHYLLTGDEVSRTGIGLAANDYMQWLPQIGDQAAGGYMEPRIQGRVLLVFLSAWRYNLPGNNWATVSRQALNNILGTQRADGSWKHVGTYYEQFNFMAGILMDAMVKYWEWFEQDARIPPVVQRTLDFLWTTQWLAGPQAFRYASGDPPSDPPGPDPAPDAQQLICSNFSWFYSLAPASRGAYKTRADTCFNGAVAGAWLDYPAFKQFNEHYQLSFRHLYYRK
jgi:hypothetical protein